jgi:hypothetical protein
MDENGYEFLESLGYIEQRFIEQAGQPWIKKTSKSNNRRSMISISHLRIAVAGIFVILFALFVILNQETDTKLPSYSDVINKIQTINGISMSLEKIDFKDDRILATVKIFDIDIKETDPAVLLNQVKINGKTLANNYTITTELTSEAETEHVYLTEYVFADSDIIPAGSFDMEINFQYTETSEENKTGTSALFDYAFSINT